MMQNIEWKVLIPSVMVAGIVPTLDIFIRFLIPIISGVVWVFLKPVVEGWRKEQIEKKKPKN